MNNYIYIIAGLPVLNQDASHVGNLDVEGILDDIKSQCSPTDNETIDFLLSSYQPDTLSEDFYLKALSHPQKFIRSFFEFDLMLRNAKTAYLNKALGRPADMDCIILPSIADKDWDEAAETADVLSGKHILDRERGLDNLYWKKVEDLTIMDLFSLSNILAFIVKMKIIDRWLKLDPQTGRELFRKLVEEIRNTR